MNTEFDMFENTGHDDTTISLATTEQLIHTLDYIDFVIPEFFDATILNIEELPIQEKVSEDCSTKTSQEEIGSIELFHYRDTPKTYLTKKIFTDLKNFQKVGNLYKATLITKSLIVHEENVPGYAKYKQKMQEALDAINALRKEGNMSEWSLATLFTSKIKHQDDFLYYTFYESDLDAEWDNHEIEGAQIQFTTDKNPYDETTFNFTYVPKCMDNSFHIAIEFIIKRVNERSLHDFIALTYMLPERLVFSTRHLPINLKTPGRGITYEMYGSCLVINIPWIQGLKFSSVNYDRRYFKLV